ncbi:response regulator transcription factor [Clostridium sp. MSJ-11]|uniref:Response regulator transcription factor n=1 Tax=Clostridium mobile TaxID=2841512 RepID=A0ABS6EK26_9CLOT|nr:response regulator transcription factor [Clostridium mobile]MBU5485567.1 response regulator transcription factor [Clostridium mobile]
MKHILLIEDDESLSRGIQYALEKEGYLVTNANTVKSSYKLMAISNFDLILLDVMLPDGNGFEFCKSIRTKSNIPIIFLTACDEEVNVVLGLDMGGDDYITKPFRVKELISRIKAILRRSEISTSINEGKINTNIGSHIRSKDIVIYPLDMKVYKNNLQIGLTPLEFKLIFTLVNHSMQVLTREQILEILWDVDGHFIDDNTLSVYIRRLREKIEDNPNSPKYIITVRGLGYKWNERLI